MDEWAPDLRLKSGESLFAIAVRDADQLWLFMSIRRGVHGDIYVNIPRDDPDWKPHASHHASGQYHHKSYGHKHREPIFRQKPNEEFRGVDNLMVTSISAELLRSVKATCDPAQFSEVFEIPIEALGHVEHHVGIDIVEPGLDAMNHVGGVQAAQRRFADGSPEILVTVWRREVE